jgi:hypothetical protein
LFDRAAYRVRQFRRSLNPRVTEAERDQALRVLGPQLYPLFASMQDADQRHCLHACEHLIEAGCEDTEMLTAALIHDAGKGSIAGARFGVHHRVLYTCIEAWPGLVAALSRWNRGIRSLRYHDRRTIELAVEYGAPEGVVELLREIENQAPPSERGRQLKAADDRS